MPDVITTVLIILVTVLWFAVAVLAVTVWHLRDALSWQELHAQAVDLKITALAGELESNTRRRNRLRAVE